MKSTFEIVETSHLPSSFKKRSGSKTFGFGTNLGSFMIAEMFVRKTDFSGKVNSPTLVALVVW